MKPIIQKIGLLIAMLSTIPTASAYDFEVDGFKYSLVSTVELTCEVAGCSFEDQESITIPEKVEYLGRTLTVVGVGASSFEGSPVKYVTLPQTVRYLARCSFAKSAIKKVTPTTNITTFGEKCFYDCCSLENIEFGQQHKVSLYSECFKFCFPLTELEIPSNVSIGSGSFYGCTGLKRAFVDSWVSSDAFSHCYALSEVILGENCKGIGKYAFSNCSALSKVILGGNCSSIGKYAFSSCSSLKYIKVPESVVFEVEEDGDGEDGSTYIFNNCTDLENVEWYANLIPNYTFTNCSNLKSLTIGANTTTIYLGSVKDNDSTPHTFTSTFENCNIQYLNLEPSARPLEMFFKVHYNGWEDNLYDYYNVEDNILRLFRNLTMLSTGRDLKHLYWEPDPLFHNLTDLIITSSSLDFSSYYFLKHIPWTQLKYLRSECKEPPRIPYAFTPSQYGTMKVEVPIEALDDYMKANVWERFWNINGIDMKSAINNVINNNNTISVIASDGTIRVLHKSERDVVRVYTIQGVLIAETSKKEICNLSEGLYIVTVANKSFKVSVK